ncbi:hypothetical protein RF11_02632 [Thelohanellus kitauei]|uniref:Uncharacterized protein n=1 Tax=Thelohanellus kitauei TaxID=669202 RepID=A0A0C2N7L2_THEKT|nr:hypothetical protein RF11_02632 [Thelohanellus kitauei]
MGDNESLAFSHYRHSRHSDDFFSKLVMDSFATKSRVMLYRPFTRFTCRVPLMIKIFENVPLLKQSTERRCHYISQIFFCLFEDGEPFSVILLYVYMVCLDFDFMVKGPLRDRVLKLVVELQFFGDPKNSETMT